MRFPRPIDSTLHGFTDYSVGATLLTVFPRLANIEGTESARQIRIAGATHASYSTLTDYPLGIVKLIPYRATWRSTLPVRWRSQPRPSSPGSGRRAAGTGCPTWRCARSSSRRSC
ncbi:MAG TPA: hypothetical protein VF032_05645 [Thermoleophilaceae bacterium]